MAFNAPYEFKQNKKHIVLRHRHGGHLRTSPQNLAHLDGEGGQGANAQWIVHLEGGHHCRLQNVRSQKFLRIWRNGNHMDCEGGLGPFSKFKIHYHHRPNGIKLESDRFHGKYVAVVPGKKARIGAGGDHCKFHAMRQGGAPHHGGGGGGAIAAAMVGGAILGAAAVAAASKPKPHHQPKPNPQLIPQQGVFQLPYQFKAHNTVVIKSHHGKYLRVHPQNLSNAEGLGGTGAFAQWKVHLDGMGVVKLQSIKSGKYLRITAQSQVNVGGTGGELTRFRYHHYQHPNGVKLQSCKFPNKYIAIVPDGRVLAGNGGIHCHLTFWRMGQAQAQPVKVVYKPANTQPTVIVQNPAPPQVVVQPVQQQSNAAQMQAQMEQMKLAQEAQLAQERAKMQQEMEAQQAALAAQQQAVLESQKAILEQQQAMLAQQNSNQSNVAVSPVSQSPVQQMEIQQEGVSGQSPVNPYYANGTSNPPPNTNSPPSYPVINEAPAVAAAADSALSEVPAPEEKKEEEPVPTMGMENANKVKQWLSAMNMERYYNSFIKNGYDTLERVGEISGDDLKEMGVALGHIKTIVDASAMAPFQNQRVRIQSVHYETYLMENEVKSHGDDKRCKLKHSKKKDGANCWLFEVIGNGTFRLKHIKTKSWLRMIKVDGSVDTRSPFSEDVSALRLIREKKGVYFIKRANGDDAYLRFAEPSTFGANKVEVVNQPMNVGRVRITCV